MNIAVSGMRPGAMFTEDLLWIEQARGAAALAVVILHVSAGVVRGVSDVTSAAWWIGNIVDSAMRSCVRVLLDHLDRPTTMCFCSLLFVLSLASALHDHVAGARRAFFLFWFLPYLSYFTAGAVMRRSSPKVGKGGLLGLVLSSVAFTAI